MSKKLESNLILNINVSSFLAGILLLVHLGGMTLAALVPLAWPLSLSICVLLGWSLYRSLRDHVWRNGVAAIVAVELDHEGAAAVRLAGDGQWHEARIAAWFVHPWLTLASLRVSGRKIPLNLAIAADAVEPEAFRRWRVRLKLRIAAA